jgi:hypothetical protein
MTTIIHVNKQNVAMNAKDGGNRPVYIVRDGRGGPSRYAREVTINGPSRFIYDGSQLRCGARAWLETEADVELIDEMSFAESREAA